MYVDKIRYLEFVHILFILLISIDIKFGTNLSKERYVHIYSNASSNPFVF